jgi:large subunit ribosomal protein L46
MFDTGISRNENTLCINLTQPQNIQTFCTVPSVKKWDLYSAVCLERHPVIIKPMREIELKFYNLLKQVEFENSLKCNYEVKKEKEEEQQKLKIADIDNVDSLVQTMQDFEDSYQEELDNFKFTPTVTGIYYLKHRNARNKDQDI